MRPKKRLIGAITVLVVAFFSVWAWQSWKAAEERRLDAAYAELFPQSLPRIENRHHSKTEAFTDTVVRYRFDGGSPSLVKQLVRRFQLTPAEVPLGAVTQRLRGGQSRKRRTSTLRVPTANTSCSYLSPEVAECSLNKPRIESAIWNYTRAA